MDQRPQFPPGPVHDYCPHCGHQACGDCGLVTGAQLLSNGEYRQTITGKWCCACQTTTPITKN
jgi:hypothetical protein